MAATAIRATGLSKTFDTGRGRNKRTVDAVRNIDITIERGERIAYIGPNGAGKSTSIKMFTGILQPTAGELSVLDLTPSKQRTQLTRRIGVLFGQRAQLWSELTAREGLRLLGAIFKITGSELNSRIDETASLLDATDLLDQHVRTFSLGQRMKCELAASILHRPEVLFLDEPTIGLDLTAKQLFRELVARLNEERGTTIFLTSHDVADIEAVAERVVIINHGTVIYDDTVDALRGSLLATKLVDVTFEHAVTAFELEGVEVISMNGHRCSLKVDTRNRAIREVLDHLLDSHAVADISVTDPPLEDVIADIYLQART
jgi:ABC-2 type transport system ATP-binding protein